MDELLLRAALALGLVAAAATAVWVASRLVQRNRERLVGRLAPEPVLRLAPESRPFVLYFSSERCGQCHRVQKPLLHELRREFDHIPVVEVDAGAHPEVARALRVLTVPSTAVVDEDGRIAALNYGLAGRDQLRLQLRQARG